MPALPITFACGLYDRMLALYTGDVKPDGIDLNFLVMDNPREIFDRMSNRLEFDACEMSSSEYITRFAAKKLPFVALPVFASRVFRHSFIIVNKKHIRSPADFAGKRVGVPLYTQTAAIFVCGLMQHDLGIDLAAQRRKVLGLARPGLLPPLPESALPLGGGQCHPGLPFFVTSRR